MAELEPGPVRGPERTGAGQVFSLDEPTRPADMDVDLGRDEPEPEPHGWLDRLLGW